MCVLQWINAWDHNHMILSKKSTKRYIYKDYIFDLQYIFMLKDTIGLCNNSYMIYIIRNPILWLGISVYGGGVLSGYFSIDDVQRNTFFVM